MNIGKISQREWESTRNTNPQTLQREQEETRNNNLNDITKGVETNKDIKAKLIKKLDSQNILNCDDTNISMASHCGFDCFYSVKNFYCITCYNHHSFL